MTSDFAHEIDDATLQAIGAVAVDAASLEWILAVLAAAGRGYGHESVTSTLSKPGEALRQFEAFVGEVDEPKLANDLRLTLAEASAQLRNRNGVIHSIAMWTVDEEDGSPVTSVFWHPRTDSERPRNAAEIAEIAHELRIVYGRAGSRLGRVEAWAAARSADQTRTSEDADQ